MWNMPLLVATWVNSKNLQAIGGCISNVKLVWVIVNTGDLGFIDMCETMVETLDIIQARFSVIGIQMHQILLKEGVDMCFYLLYQKANIRRIFKFGLTIFIGINFVQRFVEIALWKVVNFLKGCGCQKKVCSAPKTRRDLGYQCVHHTDNIPSEQCLHVAVCDHVDFDNGHEHLVLEHINEGKITGDFQDSCVFRVDDLTLRFPNVFLEGDREGEGIRIDAANLNCFHESLYF